MFFSLSIHIQKSTPKGCFESTSQELMHRMTTLEIQSSLKSTVFEFAQNLLRESLWEQVIYSLPDSPGPEH